MADAVLTVSLPAESLLTYAVPNVVQCAVPCHVERVLGERGLRDRYVGNGQRLPFPSLTLIEKNNLTLFIFFSKNVTSITGVFHTRNQLLSLSTLIQ